MSVSSQASTPPGNKNIPVIMKSPGMGIKMSSITPASTTPVKSTVPIIPKVTPTSSPVKEKNGNDMEIENNNSNHGTNGTADDNGNNTESNKRKMNDSLEETSDSQAPKKTKVIILYHTILYI